MHQSVGIPWLCLAYCRLSKLRPFVLCLWPAYLLMLMIMKAPFLCGFGR